MVSRPMRTLRVLVLAALAACWGSAPSRAEDTLYGDLGGQPVIARFVAAAVAIYLADERLKDDFDNINPDHLTKRITDQVCQISGGPCRYKGQSMVASHRGLNVTQAKFNAAVEGLQAAMEREGIPFWTQNRLLARLAPMQRDIVTR